ncbi:protein bfr2 [Cladorrhinum sp. PSN259]|nr:protein bfr2 [Cladorrhinum sp. PSN259]
MPPVARKTRASKRFAEYEERPVKEFDIENELPDDNDDGSGSDDESVDENAGTEHYVAVGKSKLRQKEIPTLGPEYRGARVSRDALENSDDDDGSEEGSEEAYDDPSLADLEADQLADEEEGEDFDIDSDNALCDSDEEKLKDFTFRASKTPREKFTKEKARKGKEVKGGDGEKVDGRIRKRPTAADFMGSSGGEEEGTEDEEDEDDEERFDSEDGVEDGSEEAGLTDDDDDDEERSDDEDDEDREDDEDEEDEDEGENGDDTRSSLKKALSQGQQTIISAMSQAAQADAKKGQAVHIQRRAFDNILHMRVRLQKALVAANTFSQVDNEEVVPTKPYQAAEEAAVKLWNIIDSVRQNFLPAKVGEKRKRTEIELDTPSQEIWESMQEIEEAALSHRRAIINKWSERVKNTSAGTTKTRNLVQNDTQSLVSVLDSQLVSSERLIKRARTPRSCAPAQAAKKVEEDPEIYDDADFYQLLLKELVDQRSADTGASGESVTTVRWAAIKEAKVRKQVDRRASKGRKLRYTVHEKLQNFMAPDDRRGWEESAIDRLFGTLFGQKLVLDEHMLEDDEDEGMSGVGINADEEGLKLFRS